MACEHCLIALFSGRFPENNMPSYHIESYLGAQPQYTDSEE